MAVGGPYCTLADIQDVLSAIGVTLSADDTPPSALGNAIDKAGNQIEKYLYARYDPAKLAQSTLVRDWAAAIAAYRLRTRRGNPAPPGVAELYHEALDDLKERQKGRTEIPGVPARKSYAPGMSKMRATLRPYPRAVVEASQGTHATGEAANYHRQTDPWDRFGWNATGYLDFSV